MGRSLVGSSGRDREVARIRQANRACAAGRLLLGELRSWEEFLQADTLDLNRLPRRNLREGVADVRRRLSGEIARSLRTPSAGLRGESQRVDVFFEHGMEDFYVNIRAKLSEAKAKTILGEFLVLMQAVLNADHPRKVKLMLLIAEDSKTTDGPLNTLLKGMVLLNALVRASRVSEELQLYFGCALPDGVRMLPLDPK